MAIDFRCRDFLDPLGILRLRHTFNRTQWLPPDALRAYQARRLADVLHHAFAAVPYYRDLAIRLGLHPRDLAGSGDFAGIPILTRQTVRQMQPQLVADPRWRSRSIPYRTSGTSGAPITILFDREANSLEFVYYWRHWSWAGYRLGDPFAELGSLHFVTRDRLRASSIHWQPHLRRLMLNSTNIRPDRVAEMLAAIRRHRPQFLKGLGSSLYSLSLCLHQMCADPLRFKAVFSTGEALRPSWRRLIESVFGGPVLDSYGQMERTVAISQCLQGGYHVNTDYGLAEFVPVAQPAAPRDSGIRAKVVGTSLYNRAMPLIRYDTEDEVLLFAEERRCECGRTLPLVKAILGRRQPPVLTPDGRVVTSLLIVPALVPGIRAVQFIQETVASLQVNVVAEDAPNDDWEAQLVRRTREHVGEHIGIVVRRMHLSDLRSTPSGKVPFIVSSIDLPDGWGEP